MSMVGIKALAYDIAIENSDGVTIYYNYINDATELEVTRYYAYGNTQYDYEGVVVIPNEVTFMNRTRKVTSIGKNTFRDCEKLTSVTIPSNISIINEFAFYGCSNLTAVNISDIADWCNITFNSNPLRYAKHLYISGKEVRDLVIPNSINKINNYAFYNCISLNKLTISNGVTSIGSGSFKGCNNLKSIDIPNSVTIIGSEAFAECESLLSLSIPNSTIKICEAAFLGCKSLKTVNLGNSVQEISNYSFMDCSSLTTINLPSSVKLIGHRSFDGINLEIITSYIEEPFEIIGKQSQDKSFSLNTFNNATICVPQGTIEKYKTTEGWKDFIFIKEELPSKITNAENDKIKAFKRYSIDGNTISTPRKGINIIRLDNETTQKVFIK